MNDAAFQRLCDCLTIPSISTDPAYTADVHRAADWVADHLRASGLSARLLDGPGHPCVLAKTTDEQVANPAAPRLLFYGHYDVQPPDPVELWTSPPFEPTVRDGKVFARGASDDKGQVVAFLEALRSFKDRGEKLPCPVTVLIEGEEECGSDHLPAVIEAHKDELAADVVLVCDTCLWDADPANPVPALTYAMRGLVYFDVKLRGPSRDLHSGVYGGGLANPATQLMRVLGHLWDQDMRITLPGLYEQVAPLDKAERQAWEQLGFDEQQFLGDVGARPFGEKGFTTLERRWARPTCDINGLYGGYMGQGAKTVIPTFAGAKVSFRIPADIDPARLSASFMNYLHDQDVGGCRWDITHLGEALPFRVDLYSPLVAVVEQAVAEVAGQPPVRVREGATIPILRVLQDLVCPIVLPLGVGLTGDNIHSPDEHLGLDRFQLGIDMSAAILTHLGKAD